MIFCRFTNFFPEHQNSLTFINKKASASGVTQTPWSGLHQGATVPQTRKPSFARTKYATVDVGTPHGPSVPSPSPWAVPRSAEKTYIVDILTGCIELLKTSKWRRDVRQRVTTAFRSRRLPALGPTVSVDLRGRPTPITINDVDGPRRHSVGSSTWRPRLPSSRVSFRRRRLPRTRGARSIGQPRRSSTTASAHPPCRQTPCPPLPAPRRRPVTTSRVRWAETASRRMVVGWWREYLGRVGRLLKREGWEPWSFNCEIPGTWRVKSWFSKYEVPGPWRVRSLVFDRWGPWYLKDEIPGARRVRSLVLEGWDPWSLKDEVPGPWRAVKWLRGVSV